ncbi:TonB-dependent siderophore receptor [Achromobacter marplatensis]|jgi:iron complex outermembrane receptor protein|uniref:TonB-dependent siderophore receptor n=1 Tax=Achromobacter marplatensis TaxID=470868 RepID=A0AA42W631_9BURK|nr:TonB-dependent siderophore receptor [Achromobacter marplatensis]MDH2049300.1 TonB-dependent siderophore receptor [Achromobacter marplatensis]
MTSLPPPARHRSHGRLLSRLTLLAPLGLSMQPALAASGAQPAPTLAQAATAPAAIHYDIPPGPLSQVLTQISSRAKIFVVADSALTGGKRSSGLSGTYTPQEAMSRVLGEQGLRAAQQSNGTWLVQAAPAPGVTTLQPVTVSGRQDTARGAVDGIVATRSLAGTKTDTSLLETPQVINVITRDQMNQQGANSVAEALRYTPGVIAEPNGFDVRYDWNYVRGYSTMGTQWLDGLALPGDPSSYAVPRINGYALERVEVIKGPASVLYGKSVPGGLLNQVGKRPQEEAMREVQVQASGFGGTQFATDLTGPVTEDGQWLYRVVGLQRQLHTQVDLERDRQTLVAPSLTWRPSAATSLTLNAFYQKDKPQMSARFYPAKGTLHDNPAGNIPRSMYLGEPSSDSFNRTYQSIGYEFEHKFNDTTTVRQNLRFAQGKQDMFLIRAHPFVAYQPDGHTLNRVSAISDDSIKSLAVDSQIETRFDTGALRHTLLVGLDLQRGTLSNNFANSSIGVPPLDILDPIYDRVIPKPPAYTSSSFQNVRQVGLYAQDQIRFGRAIATLGLRHDDSRISANNRITNATTITSDSKVTGRAGLTYVFDNGIAPYASYSTSFLPTTGLDRQGNTFKPQTGRQFEFGAKYEPAGGWGFATLSFFRNDMKNARTPDPVDSIFFVQSGKQRVQGIEFEGKAQLSTNLDFLLSYSYMNSEVRSSSNPADVGRHMLYVPEHQASAWINYRLPAVPGLQVGIGGRFMSSYDTASDYNPDLTIPSLFLADASVAYDFGAVSNTLKGTMLRVSVWNLADKSYVSHCLNATGATCNYGARRSVIANLTYRW